MAKKKQKSSKVAGFIIKLVEIIKSRQNQELISYQEERRCFRIKNVRKFTEIILPKYFKHKNYSSFIRQVNLYSFHKLPNQGKQEIYQQQFFNIDSIKDLKKIKRKLMGSEIKRNQKKSHSQSGHSDSQYNCHDDSDSYSIQKQQNNHLHQEKESKESMQVKIQELQKKKVLIQNKIKLEQQNNVRLEFQNKQLRNTFQDENLNFYADTLNILINLALSQYQLQLISHENYQKLIKYLLEQQKQLSRIQQLIKDSQQNEKIEENVEDSIGKLSQFLTSLRFIIGEQNDPNTIPVFLQNLLNYIQGQERSSQKQISQSNKQKIASAESQQYSNWKSDKNISNSISQQNNLLPESQIENQNFKQAQQFDPQIKQDKINERKKKTIKKHLQKQQDDEYFPENR